MPRITPPRSTSESARRRRAAGEVPPPALSNTRDAAALEDARRAAYTAAAANAKKGLDYTEAFHALMRARGFERGEACTCGWAKIGRHTLECGYTEQERTNGKKHCED